MSKQPWRLSRRTFLRGTGVAMAVPFLDAMRPMTAFANSAAAKPPVRMAAMYFPNGAFPASWVPAAAGAEYELPFALEPIAKLKDQVLVISGLDKAASHEGDGHYAKMANFLTGLHVNKTTGRDISVGSISVDQLAAQKLGDQTPLPSMELGIDPVISGIDSNVGYTRLYGSYISWRSASLPVAREINPRAVYDRLFGSKDGGSSAGAGDNRSLLDGALDDARDLRHKLGRDDQVKMDEYLDAVRSVEKRLDFTAKPDQRAWHPQSTPDHVAPPDAQIPKDYQEHVRLMLDMIVLAFWTDQTRIATFMFANEVSGRNFGPYVDGANGSHHEFSHHENDAHKIEAYKKINRWHVEQFAWMLDKMKAIKEGEGTLLDNSMILCGGGMSDGNRHDPANLPILLAGRGGGTLSPGRHLACAQGTPLCNLHLAMLDRIGAPTKRFGDSTGPLKGLDEV